MPPPYPDPPFNGVIQPKRAGNGNNLNPAQPIVKLYTPPPPRHVPVVVPDPFALRPVPIFDIRNRGTAHILNLLPRPEIRILSPEEIQQQKREARRAREEREDEEFRQIERRNEANLRRAYNDLHTDLVSLRYETINHRGLDLTGGQFNLLEAILRDINANSLGTGGPHSHSYGATAKTRLDACEVWISIIRPALPEWCSARAPLLDVEEIAEQLIATVEDTENLRNRKTLRPELGGMVREMDSLKLIYSRFRAAATCPNNDPRSLLILRQACNQLTGLTNKIKAFKKKFEQLGATIEDAVPEIRIVPKIVLTPAEQLVVNAWNAAYGLDNSPYMANQIRRILSTGDFQMLRELTAIVTYIKANRNVSPLRFRAVDLHAHALTGGLKHLTSFDFPFLNKTRLGDTHRGIWRIMFYGARVYGIYNDHDGAIDKWSGEGLAKSAA